MCFYFILCAFTDPTRASICCLLFASTVQILKKLFYLKKFLTFPIQILKGLQPEIFGSGFSSFNSSQDMVKLQKYDFCIRESFTCFTCVIKLVKTVFYVKPKLLFVGKFMQIDYYFCKKLLSRGKCVQSNFHLWVNPTDSNGSKFIHFTHFKV